MDFPLDFSVVIPAYNEESRLPRTLDRVREYLKSHGGTYEVIVVDDGSRDGTAQLVESRRAGWPELRLVKNPGNRGKGYSVRHGMLEAQGKIVLFSDADLSTPIEEADKLLAALATHDIAIGSRAVDRKLIEVRQPWVRETLGKIFNGLVRVVVGLKFSDTQCGFKAFRAGPSRIVFEQQSMERFGFDPEVLFIAQRQGLTVAEVPVRWADDPATRLNAMWDGPGAILELVRIRWNALAGRYPVQRRGD